MDRENLLSAYSALMADGAKLRARDAAARLGVPEGQLADARTLGGGFRRLAFGPDGPAGLMEAMQGLGRVMTLVRNETAVHETHGTFGAFRSVGRMGQVTGAIDLRLFFAQWGTAFAAVEEVKSGERRSIQVYDRSGDAILKVYAGEGTDMAAWSALCEAHADDTAPAPAFEPRPEAEADRPDAEIDVAALREGWNALEHTHEFFRLLRETGAGRQQALRLAGPDLAVPLDTGAATRVLEGAAAAGVPIMCFVGNRGAIQIFSGPVSHIKPMGPWINVLDPDFNLHLRTDRVATAWLVRKPTAQRGLITSVELFDASGEMVCQFFGQRPEGEAERAEWRALAEGLRGEVAA